VFPPRSIASSVDEDGRDGRFTSSGAGRCGGGDLALWCCTPTVAPQRLRSIPRPCLTTGPGVRSARGSRRCIRRSAEGSGAPGSVIGGLVVAGAPVVAGAVLAGAVVAGCSRCGCCCCGCCCCGCSRCGRGGLGCRWHDVFDDASSLLAHPQQPSAAISTATEATPTPALDRNGLG